MDNFDAIADKNRRKILETLSDTSSLSSGEIAAHFNITPQAISQHLKILLEANLIELKKDGQFHRYSLRKSGLNPLKDWFLKITRK